MTRAALRAVVTALLTSVAALSALVPAAATTAAEPEQLQASAAPDVAAPADTVLVTGSGWPAGTQVQAVVCGDLAIGGSAACDATTGALGTVGSDGRVELDLVVGKPPRPCPCVVRLASYTGAVVAVDIPFEIVGHPVGTPPAPVLSVPRLVVVDAELEGGGGIAALFGAAPDRQLVLTVRNAGAAAAVEPVVELGIGRSASAGTTPQPPQPVTIEPLETAELAYEVGLPFAAFGDYRVVGSVGAGPSARFDVGWTTYPWGLVALNLLGIALLAAGIAARARRRRRRLALAPAVTPGTYPLPDVVYVGALGGFLVSPQAAGRSGLLKRLQGRLEGEDLAALLAGGAVSAAGPDDGPATAVGSDRAVVGAVAAPTAGAAVVDLVALDRQLRRRAGWPPTEVVGGAGSATAPGQPDARSPDPAGDPAGGAAVIDLAALDAVLDRRGSGPASRPA